jgi:hypothetical protein
MREEGKAMTMRGRWRLTTVGVATLLTGVLSVAGQAQAKIWQVEVLLNQRPLMSGHTHVAPNDRRAGVDEICIAMRDIERLLGGAKYVARRGSNLEAVEGRPGRGAMFRVQRAGRISSKVHRMGDEEYIPLGDLARALGAKVVREKPGQVNLVLERSAAGSILALNK